MRLRIYSLLAVLWPVINCYSQYPPNSIRPLTIGDIVPDIVFKNVINYKYNTANLSDFKGKQIILDFWSSWCGSCISLFPHLDSLQSLFKKDLQIILVNTKSKETNDDKTKITKILEKVRKRTGAALDMPVVYNSEELDVYFPCIAIPHEVWIDKKGKIIGITSSTEVTDTNIQSVLVGVIPSFHIKKDVLEFDKDTPLFVNGNGGNGQELKYRSMITNYVEGLNGGSGFRLNDGKINGLYVINGSLLSMVKNAFNDVIVYPDNRIIIQSDNKKFNVGYEDTAKYSNTYCYDLIVPPTDEVTIRSYMQSDLKRYFNINVHKERRRIKCLILELLNLPQARPKIEQQEIDIEKETIKKYIYGYPPEFVTDLLNRFSHFPIINETNTQVKIAIDLPYDINNVKDLQKAFRKIGFTLKEDEREMEVIVITDTCS